MTPTSFWDRFKDPVDGRFDVTAAGDDESGFIPIAVPFNEPSFGAGLVATVLYFHPDVEPEPVGGAVEDAPPTTTFGDIGASDDDSWVAAGGHSAVLRDGWLRYLGVLGTGSINLDYHGIGKSPDWNQNPLSFNIKGDVLTAQERDVSSDGRS